LSSHVDTREEDDGGVEIFVGDVGGVDSASVRVVCVACVGIGHGFIAVAAKMARSAIHPIEGVVVMIEEVVAATAEQTGLGLSKCPPKEGFDVRRHTCVVVVLSGVCHDIIVMALYYDAVH